MPCQIFLLDRAKQKTNTINKHYFFTEIWASITGPRQLDYATIEVFLCGYPAILGISGM
jgi:hypothetical protein